MTDMNFLPEAEVGHNVAIHYLGSVYYRRVTFWEAIPWFQFLNIGAVALQTGAARAQATLLNQFDDEWAQFRWYPMDYVQVRMFLPNAQGKMTMRNIQVPLDNQIVFRDPCLHLTEFHVWEDNCPWMEALNFPDYAAIGVRLMCAGYRYIGDDIQHIPDGARIISRIQAGTEPCKHIWCSGAASVRKV